jgi:hypothetical protein
VFVVGFSRIFFTGDFNFKRLTARHLYKSFGVKGLILLAHSHRNTEVLIEEMIGEFERSIIFQPKGRTCIKEHKFKS